MCISDPNASLPEGVNPFDVAALAKYYLASLPEPLTTLELYDEIKGARSSIHAMRNTLKKLSNVNFMTLEYVTALLLRVSQKSLLNKVGSISVLLSLDFWFSVGWEPVGTCICLFILLWFICQNQKQFHMLLE